MSSDAEIEGLIEALQQDAPSERDAARVRARLAAAGIVTASVLGHGTASASVPVAKATGSIVTSLSARWAGMSLLPKLGVVAVSAAAVAGPIYGARLVEPPPAPHAAVSQPARGRAPARPIAAAPAVRTPREAKGAEAVPTAIATVHPARDEVRATKQAVSLREPSPTAAIAAKEAAGGHGDALGVTADRAGASVEGVGTARFAAEQGASAPPPPAPASTLAEETALLDQTFAALRAGDATTASALVAEHARRFPQGLLWRERERARTKLESLGAAAPQ
jgi:hypothetical protein